MAKTERPKPPDEGVTRRWRPGGATVELRDPPTVRDPIPTGTIPTGTLPVSRAPSDVAVPPSRPNGIEVVVVEEAQLAGGERRPWRAAEVWTKRRVYGLDSTFKCVEVVDRESGRPEPSHEMLGARLGGGRLRAAEKVRFSYPLPLPGMEAMFMRAKKHGYTSPVERMIVRVRALVTSADDVAPSWDEIASRWSEPPSR